MKLNHPLYLRLVGFHPIANEYGVWVCQWLNIQEWGVALVRSPSHGTWEGSQEQNLSKEMFHVKVYPHLSTRMNMLSRSINPDLPPSSRRAEACANFSWSCVNPLSPWGVPSGLEPTKHWYIPRSFRATDLIKRAYKNYWLFCFLEWVLSEVSLLSFVLRFSQCLNEGEPEEEEKRRNQTQCSIHHRTT